MIIYLSLNNRNDGVDLISSKSDTDIPVGNGSFSNNDEKLAFTIWTTAQTTTTATVLYTNDATTINLSYICTVGGNAAPSVYC